MQKLIVIDEFYENPDAVRNLALQAEYQDVVQLNYPGFQSRYSYSSDSIVHSFAKLIGKELSVDPAKLTFAKFRIMLESTGSRLKVHLDGESDWTGLIFLNPDSSCQGGTAFYRHKSTGLEGHPSNELALKNGFSSSDEFEKSIVEPDTLNPDAWEVTMFVGMRFNRLLLFKGNELFHCHTKSFGTTRENGRLTQNFFFNEK